LRRLNIQKMKYADAYKQSVSEPAAFWGKAGEAIEWTRKWDKVLDDSGKPFYRWFAGGEWPLPRNWPKEPYRSFSSMNDSSVGFRLERSAKQ